MDPTDILNPDLAHVLKLDPECLSQEEESHFLNQAQEDVNLDSEFEDLALAIRAWAKNRNLSHVQANYRVEMLEQAMARILTHNLLIGD